MPKQYTTYIKDMNDLDRSLVVNKKPYFQKYIYPKLNHEYNEYVKFKDYYSLIKYGIDCGDNKDEEFIEYINFKNPVLDNNSIVNKVCHYLEKEIFEIKENYKSQNQDIVDNILIDTDRELLLEYNELFNSLLGQYKQFREKERTSVTKYSSQEESNKHMRFKDIKKDIRKKAYEIIDNSIDIANIAIYCGYNGKSEINKDFVWNIFGKEVFENVKKNSISKILSIPVECQVEESEFIYLGKNYKEEVVNK